MIPLIPLISLAASLVPELVGLFGGRRAGEVAGKVAQIVCDVTGTADPVKAQGVIEKDPAEAARLRARLQEVRQEYLRLQLEDAQDERRAMVATLRAEVEDRSRAAATMVSALQVREWPAKLIALAPAIVSAVVVIGFFAFIGWMVRLPPSSTDTSTLALLNVVVGALVAAFTAVINFWLGSSQGSRDKDQAVAALQQAQMASTPTSMREASSPATTAGAGVIEAVPPPTADAEPIPGVAGRFKRCFEQLLEKEGGFVHHPQDQGGPTKMGITQRTLAAWRHAPVGEQDVAQLERDEACEIYRANYWNVMRCDDLPTGVDLMVFDFGVNAGPGTSVRLLQRVAGAEPDGAVGPLTLRAVRSSQPRVLIDALSAARLDFYKKLASYDTFGKGWEMRTAAIQAKAIDMCTV